MYYFPQPPFLVICLGLFISVICGLTFKTQLEQRIQTWTTSNRSDQDLYKLKGFDLRFSYWGICLGVWVFLAGGLLIFGFGVISAYGVTLPLAIATGALVWTQLQEVLSEWQKGGSKALDLDSFN
jgi:hypothetical protein